MTIWTQHNDNFRSGLNSRESTLNVNNVNSSQFGFLFSRAVDDKIYAQPLYVGSVAVPNIGTKNLVFVATASNTVYAFDADDAAASAPVWSRSLNAGESPVQANNVGYSQHYGTYQDMSGNIGIIGTPVIDPSTDTLYVVARTEGYQWSVQRLHALSIATGAELPGWPIAIQASVPGSNELGPATIDFLSHNENQRAALTLWRPPSGTPGNPVVFIAWGSHGDSPPYHGWLIGYDTVTRSQVAVFNTTPNIREWEEYGTNQGGGSIWQAGQGPAVDDEGNMYFMTGNGEFNETKQNFGTSFVKLSFSTTTGFSVADFFTPAQWGHFNYWDVDLGSAGVLLVPESNFLVGGGKDGWLYPIDRTNMGHLEASQYSRGLNATGNHIGLRHIHGSPVTWVAGALGRLIYVWGENDVLRSFQFDPATGSLGAGTYAKGDIDTGCGALAITCMPGGMLSVSASGTSAQSGIIWASVPDGKDAIHHVAPGRLIAFQAYPVQGKILELWRSDKSPGHASAPNRTDAAAAYNFSKFTPPTVVNGKVYLATFSNELRVYGLK